jgi:raffinose/stachyose/melibiose transport system substrate-binding protein
MKRKLAVLMTMVMGLGLTVSGCGSSGGDSSGSSSDANTITLSCSGTESDAYTQGIKDIVAAFNESNEYGVTIETEFQATSDYKTKLSTTMASDAEPDIFFTYELSFLENYVNGDKVVDLQEYLDADSDWADSFNGGVLEQVTYDGDVYAIPFAQCVAVMYYNTAIFDEYNLSVPTTYDEYTQVCDTLLENGVTPVALASTSDDAWLVSQYIQQLSNGIVGSSLFDSLNAGTGKWNDDAFIQAAALFQNEVNSNYYENGFTGVGNDEARAIFQNGQAAMYFNGTWEVPNLSDESLCAEAANISCFAMPAYDSQYNNISMGALDGSFAISKNCQNVEAAVAFLKMLTNADNAGMMLYDYGKLPSTNIDIDTTQISSLCADAITVMNEQTALTAWFDRMDTDLGNEFNNCGVAISNGDDPQTTYDDLEAYAEANQ